MATVAGIGVGLFILIFVWVLCLFVCVAFSRAEGGLAFAGIGAVVLAVILTLILALMPRGAPPLDDQYIKFDDMYIPRTVIISICGVFLALGLIFYAFLHTFEQRRAAPLKKLRT